VSRSGGVLPEYMFTFGKKPGLRKVWMAIFMQFLFYIMINLAYLEIKI